MNPTDYLIILIPSAALAFMAWWVTAKMSTPTVTTKGVGKNRGWVLDLCRLFGEMVMSVNPTYWRKKSENLVPLLEKAGLYPRWEYAEFVGARILGMIIAVILTEFLLFPGDRTALLVGLALGLHFPMWYVKKKRTERQLDLLRSFPTAIDMMVLAVEGGLDVSTGIKEMIEHSQDSALREEFYRLHHEISIGEPRTTALRRFAQRMDAMEIKAVLMSLVQAIEMGSEIAPILRMQSEQLRFNRLVRAEEAANKAPTKMMIPMVLFIMPCMFLVIFAPIAIGVMQSFSEFTK